MPKPFAHGTVRSWKRGNVMKHGAAWTKLARERIAPVQPVAAVAPTSFGGDPYAGAAPFTPEMSGTLGAIASKLGEGRKSLVKSVWDYVDTDDGDEKTRIIKSLLAGYKDDGIEGMKSAAYRLEPQVSKQMLSSILKGAIRDGMLGSEKLVFKGHDATTLGMYADDLRLGR